MEHHQSGFTLVDLAVVMMIFGILAASALPKLINLTIDARIVNVEGLSSGLRSATGLLETENIAPDNDKTTSLEGSSTTFQSQSGRNTTCQTGKNGTTSASNKAPVDC
jgi:MSHA pilin protein MshB